MKTAKNTSSSDLSMRAKEALKGWVMTEHDMRDRLTDMVAEHGSQKAVADILGVSKGYLNDVLMGRRPVSAQMAERLGWKRFVLFVGRG